MAGASFTLDARAVPNDRRAPRETRMTWMILAVGLVVGLFSGVVGIGGGILFVPALIWLLGMDQHKAQGTSLGALLLPVGMFAFLEYYRKGNADVRVAALLAAGFLVGGYFGAVGAQHIPEVWLRRIFALTLIAVGGKLLFSS
ncbi:MAG: sulfite exporter TauE/SafE family protein [Terracidiphilus sp.]